MDCRTISELLTYYLVVPAALFFNFIAIYIIWKHSSNNEMSSYRAVLLVTCVVDTLHALYYLFLDMVSARIHRFLSQLGVLST